jgi:membrane dipeptidase
VFAHPRNIDDTRLQALARRGGVISMNSLGAYLVPIEVSDERKAALAQISKRFGSPHTLDAEAGAALVTARAEVDRRYPVRKATFDDYMAHVLHALSVVGPDHVGIGADWDGGGGVVGLEDVEKLPRITQRLTAAGYSETDIAKIWGGNVLRVLRAAERVRDEFGGPT